eukprot:snap_masked-scaffold_28-processed-gene-3.38-mRNA-1 protein AED:1.00 eAED:1.00 QI:0/0/0/0/1/1/2/0/201
MKVRLTARRDLVSDFKRCTEKQLLDWFEEKLNERFEIRCEELTDSFVGTEIVRHNDCLYLSQRSRVLKLAEKYNLREGEAPSVVTPMVENPQLPDGNEIELRALQKLVGELSYVSNNGRPDIAFPVNFIARHVQYKKLGLFRMGRKILRYLINTKNMAIMIKRSESLTLTAFSDAAFADCLEDKFKSSSGFVILLGSVPIV